MALGALLGSPIRLFLVSEHTTPLTGPGWCRPGQIPHADQIVRRCGEGENPAEALLHFLAGLLAALITGVSAKIAERRIFSLCAPASFQSISVIDEIDEEYEKPRNALLANSQRWFGERCSQPSRRPTGPGAGPGAVTEPRAPLPKYLNPVQLRALPVPGSAATGFPPSAPGRSTSGKGSSPLHLRCALLAEPSRLRRKSVADTGSLAGC